MKLKQLLAHYGIHGSPFGEEDAQSDTIFKECCINHTYHPAWEKISGSASDPSTAVFFGEKGTGKTALRIQLASYYRTYNIGKTTGRVFVVEYEDFNCFLDAFQCRYPHIRDPEELLSRWRLWDHMDAILSICVTQLVDIILALHVKDKTMASSIDWQDEEDKSTLVSDADLLGLSPPQKRDLLLLTALYDKSLATNVHQRWQALRKVLKWNNSSYIPTKPSKRSVLGLAGTAAFGGFAHFVSKQHTTGATSPLISNLQKHAPGPLWMCSLGVLALSWMPKILLDWYTTRRFKQVACQIQILDSDRASATPKLLKRFPGESLTGQPMPSNKRTEDRYQLLAKLQGILQKLGFKNLCVLMDRVDEPHLVNGNPERMKLLVRPHSPSHSLVLASCYPEQVWPLFDNKFLQQKGFSMKLLLPIELSAFLKREGREFAERSRLDKQNLIPDMSWSGESLYDIVNDRMQFCAGEPASKISLQHLFDPSVRHEDLISAFAKLRAPRHLFKFMYRLLVAHCNNYTEENPEWTIKAEALQSTLAVFLKDMETQGQNYS